MTAASGMERHVEMLHLLVESGADPHTVSELGYNAFHAAVDVNGEANEESSVRSVLGYLDKLGVSLDSVTTQAGRRSIRLITKERNSKKRRCVS